MTTTPEHPGNTPDNTGGPSTDDAGHNYTRPDSNTPTPTPPAPNATTSGNTPDDNQQPRTLGDRTAAQGTSGSVRRVPAGRLLVCASPDWPIPGSVVHEVTRWRYRLGYRDWTLVVGEKCGLDTTLARLWGDGGLVERCPDPAVAVTSCDAALVFLADLEPWALAVYDAAHDAGVPTVLDHTGRWPWPPGHEGRTRVLPDPNVRALKWRTAGRR